MSKPPQCGLAEILSAVASAGSIRGAAKLIGMEHSGVFRRLQRAHRNGEIAAMPGAGRPVVAGDRPAVAVAARPAAPLRIGAQFRLPLSALRAAADPVARLLAVVAGIPPGELAHESALRAQIGVGERRWAKVLHDPRLARHAVRVQHHPPYPDGTYLGSAADICAAKTELTKASYR